MLRWWSSALHKQLANLLKDLRIPLTNISINIVGVVVYLRKKRVAVLSVYRPPNTPLSQRCT